MMKRWVLALMLFSVGYNCAADDIRPAWLQLTEASSGGSFDVIWKQPITPGKRGRIEPSFSEICTTTGNPTVNRTDEWLTQYSRLSCGDQQGADQTVSITGLEQTVINVFVRLVSADGSVKSFIVKPREPVFVFNWATQAADDADLLTYFTFGVMHLLEGYDHVLFVIALVLLVRVPIKLVQVVTSFTVAHSLTLAAATLGLVSISQNAVEAVIALSIVFLALELIKAQQDKPSLLVKYPWTMTFVLGLLHGFGFAGALTEIGLPQETIALALLLFNLGVEVGQLIIVAMVLAGLFFSRTIAQSLVVKLRSLPAYLIGSIASFWLIQRLLILF